jgi:putative tryptophan/tyrosine transport system substrate-binding protein
MTKYSTLFAILFFISCKPKDNLPIIGFVDAFEDATMQKAKKGFFDALDNAGFSEQKKTIHIEYKNAQSNIATLTQIVQYFKGIPVTCIAACPSISAITAVQNTKSIPIFMMVSPTPTLMKLPTQPSNLFGTADDLSYIDTSFLLIKKLLAFKNKPLKVGMIFNQSEPQSVNAVEHIRQLSKQLNMQLIILPVNESANAKLVTASLLSNNIDAFFANPDNVVFSAFETILQNCNAAKVPIFTSEEGLVARGAVAAFGADIYKWGYQTGQQTALYLQQKNTKNLNWQMVAISNKVINKKAAASFGISYNKEFKEVD